MAQAQSVTVTVVVTGEPVKHCAELAGPPGTLGAELAGAEPAGAEPAGAEPAGAELAGAELAGAELVGADWAGVETDELIAGTEDEEAPAPAPEPEPEQESAFRLTFTHWVTSVLFLV